MPNITRSALVSFSALEMFNLVNDIKSYPEFLPGCIGASILSQAENEMVASVEVEKFGIKKSFVTRNRLIVGESILMELVEGPFKQLTGGWTFTSLSENASKVELSLQFEFTNKLVELAFGKVFNELAVNMVSAFSDRAKLVYRR
ncbi:SRPBCC family protein [Thorsellia anophelis]|uniref:Ribosome association toxin PasT (RatA) of the RatAB toxin-antitoxin module n=1 Tax=Thorsellia anophelis DSM 18579 TaxID=1123402 RepID=A0A1I0DP59_9GAMM|nr:SRPBCC family protein [Thorsellia anophelis]SET34331.1 Ribosome association toxin PasT (RatA) of the RatAB toxin-antitoxin module [Thorsellia anophelis DSM 18579]